MTLEEAIKILKKEGFKLEGPGKPEVVNKSFTEYESREICEAMQTACCAGFQIMMLAGVFEARKARLRLELAENTKTPGPGEEQPKEGNPALKEAASQFNDVLLDEQTKKIAKLTKENERLKDQIAVLDACKKHNDKIDRLQINRLGKEIARLNGIIHDKNEEIKRKTKGCCELITEKVDLKKELSDKYAVLSDVAEELRLSKIREKNLTEVCQKYIKANGELKEKLADKVVEKIDAQALKSAESALAYKEKVIDKLTKENNDYKKCVEEFRNKIADMTIGKIDIQNIRLKEKDKEIKELNDKLKSINENRHKELTEKDEVITDLGKELKAMKQQLGSYTKMAQKMAEVIAYKKPVTVDFFEMCWELAYSEEKKATEELSKVLNDVIDRFLLFGGIITKEE